MTRQHATALSRSFAIEAGLPVAVMWVLAALACFAALDTTTKVVGLAAPLMMAMWFRFLFQAVVTTALLAPRQGRALLRTRRPMLQVWRGLSLLSCSVFAFLSLQHLPVGEFTAIVMLSPMAITLMAARTLGERVGLTRWLLLLAGLAGALVIIRPGSAMFGWAAVLPLGLVVANTVYQLVTSRLSRIDDTGTMQFYTGWMGTAITSLLVPWVWQPLAWSTWAQLALIGAFGTVGHLLLIHGYRRAPASLLAPFLYFQIAFATLSSWWVFDHAPDTFSWIGLLTIGACGMASAVWPPGGASAGRR